MATERLVEYVKVVELLRKVRNTDKPTMITERINVAIQTGEKSWLNYEFTRQAFEAACAELRLSLIVKPGLPFLRILPPLPPKEDKAKDGEMPF